MDDATERRIVYGLCLAGSALALVALYQGLARSDVRVMAVSLALIGIMVATAIAASRSGRVRSETGEE